MLAKAERACWHVHCGSGPILVAWALDNTQTPCLLCWPRLTGGRRRDDPTIMAWELCNEPRCEGDFSASILQDWVEQQAEFLKSLDPFHLLTIGTEGFLGSSTPGAPLRGVKARNPNT